jgi:PPM family protein phosphatase
MTITAPQALLLLVRWLGGVERHMNEVDAGVIVVLLAGVAALGYALGRRRESAPPPLEPPQKPISAVATRTKPKPAPAADPKPRPAADPKPRPAADPKPRPAAENPKPRPAAENPKPAPEPKLKPAREVVNLAPSDTDELDVTRVGPLPSGPPPSPKRTIYQPPLQRIVFDPEAEADETESDEKLFLVHATAQTDTGLRRKHNEDSLLVLESLNLFVVADGMGGYKGGLAASELVIKTMSAAARSSDYEGPPHEEVPAEASELARAIQMANAEIQELATRQPDLEGMGTTVCAARFSPNKKRLYVGHVGDSRCYRLRDGVFTMMTADHTMAEHGVKGPESAHLSRAVGIWPTVPIDMVMAVPQLGDVYLLCSDGLTKMLNDDIIANVLRTEEDPKVAVDRLILFANSRGGKDNITVVLVRVVPPMWTPRTSLVSDEELRS